MSCKEYEKDLLLYADGEIEGEASLHLIAHLQVCPACSRRVYSEQQLQASIARIMGELKPPPALAGSILSLLEAADVQEHPKDITPATRFHHFLRPLGIAAIVGLAVIGTWQLKPYLTNSGNAVPNYHAVDVTDESDVAVKLAGNVHKLHIHCATWGAAHQDPNLSTDPGRAAEQLSSVLGIPILTGEQLRLTNGKTRFESARLCSLIDAAGAEHDAAHLIYRSRDNEAISLLSMKTFAELTGLKTRVVSGRAYAVLEPGISTKCRPFTIVEWSANSGSYVVCSPFGYEETMASVETLRVALDTGGPPPTLWLAALDP